MATELSARMGDPLVDPGSIYPRDHSTARALLAGHIGTEPFERLQPIGEGDFCFAFLSGNRIVRVAKHAEAAAALRAEACVLARIAARLPLPVPRPAYAAPREDLAYSVHPVLTGEVLTRELWLEMSVAQRDRTASELAEFFRVLHGIPADVAAGCGLNRLDLAELGGRLYDEVPRALLPLLDRAAGTALLELLGDLADATARNLLQDSLIHCDVAPGHVLVDRDFSRLTGVIDFGDLAIGDPARDFIYVYEDFGPEILHSVLSYYEREAPGSLMPRIRCWYLVEAVDWTVKMLASGRTTEVQEGIREIARELSIQEPVSE